MKDNSNIAQIFKLKRQLDTAMDNALSVAAKRIGITPKIADVVIFLFYGGNGTALEEFGDRGFSEEIESLCENKLAEITDNRVSLTSRGEIAGKSLSQAQEKFFDAACKDVTPEERFIVSIVLEKIRKNLIVK